MRPTFKKPPVCGIADEAIDKALGQVENMSILRGILSGKTWKEAFGRPGGGTLPRRPDSPDDGIFWSGDSKGISVYFYPRLDRPDIKITPAQIIARAKKYRTGGPEIDYEKVVFGTDEELNGELDKVAPRKEPDPQVLEAARIDTRSKRIRRGEPADSVDWIRWAWKKDGGRLPEEPPEAPHDGKGQMLFAF